MPNSASAQAHEQSAHEQPAHGHQTHENHGVHKHETPESQFPVGSRIYFGDSGANLIRVDSKSWAELGADEKLAFIFDETSRDAKSIVLKDTERPGVVLTVDLTEKVVKFNGAVIGAIVKMTKGKGNLKDDEVGEVKRLTKYSVTFHNESDRSVSVHAVGPIKNSRNDDTVLGKTDNHLVAPTTVAPKSSLTMINLPAGAQFKLEDPLLGFTNHKLDTLAVRLTYGGTGSFRAHEAPNLSNGANPVIVGQQQPQSVPNPETQPHGQATYSINYINRTQSKVPFKLHRSAMVGVYVPEDHKIAPGETKLQALGKDRFSFQALLEVNGRSYAVNFRKANGTVVIDANGVTYDGFAIQGNPVQKTQRVANEPATKQPFPILGFWFKPAQGGLYVEAVEVGSTAQNIGMRPGQTITAFNGVSVQDEQAYRYQMTLAVQGNGRVTLTVRDANGFQAQLETRVKAP